MTGTNPGKQFECELTSQYPSHSSRLWNRKRPAYLFYHHPLGADPCSLGKGFPPRSPSCRAPYGPGRRAMFSGGWSPVGGWKCWTSEKAECLMSTKELKVIFKSRA